MDLIVGEQERKMVVAREKTGIEKEKKKEVRGRGRGRHKFLVAWSKLGSVWDCIQSEIRALWCGPQLLLERRRNQMRS